MPKDRVLSVNQVLHLTGFSRTTLYALLKTGDFAPKLRLSTKRVGFRESDVQEWLNSRAAAA